VLQGVDQIVQAELLLNAVLRTKCPARSSEKNFVILPHKPKTDLLPGTPDMLVLKVLMSGNCTDTRSLN
jgi:hypothetical protein